MQNALGNVREMNTVSGALQKVSARGLIDMADYNEVYEMVIEKYGQKNADEFMKLGLFGIDDKFLCQKNLSSFFKLFFCILCR